MPLSLLIFAFRFRHDAKVFAKIKRIPLKEGRIKLHDQCENSFK